MSRWINGCECYSKNITFYFITTSKKVKVKTRQFSSQGIIGHLRAVFKSTTNRIHSTLQLRLFDRWEQFSWFVHNFQSDALHINKHLIGHYIWAFSCDHTLCNMVTSLIGETQTNHNIPRTVLKEVNSKYVVGYHNIKWFCFCIVNILLLGILNIIWTILCLSTWVNVWLCLLVCFKSHRLIYIMWWPPMLFG